jgi:hypothetical protein
MRKKTGPLTRQYQLAMLDSQGQGNHPAEITSETPRAIEFMARHHTHERVLASMSGLKAQIAALTRQRLCRSTKFAKKTSGVFLASC